MVSARRSCEAFFAPEVRSDAFCLSANGKLDYRCRRDFGLNMEKALASGKPEIWLYFGEVRALDSSFLGCLLLWRERADAVRCKIKLHCAGTVLQVMELSGFRALFEITELNDKNKHPKKGNHHA